MARRALPRLAIVLLLASGCSAGGDPFIVDVADGVQPRLHAGAVADLIRDVMEQNAADEEAPDVAIDIVSVSAMDIMDMPAAVPGIEAIGGDPAPSGVVWVVEAHGPYISHRGPPPGAEGPRVRTGTHGWWVVADSDGSIISMEMDSG